MTGPVPADMRTALAGIPKVRHGLDPRAVAAVLRAVFQQVDEARAARKMAEESDHRAKEAMRRWQSEHAQTCQMPVTGRPSQLRLPAGQRPGGTLR